MAVIAVYSPKGGVGKTTIAVDLAWRFAVSGSYRTLLWDIDIQGGAGYLLGASPGAMAKDPALLERPDRLRQLISATAYDNLSYLGLDRSFRNLSFNLLRLGPRRRIGEIVRTLRGSYDRIVLDCPPVRDEISDQIIEASDLMIVPLPASPLAARALDLVRSDLAERNLGRLPILPIFSMFDSRRKAHRLARDGWMAEFPIIPAASQIEQAAFRQAPAGTLCGKTAPGLALARLWRGIEFKLGEMGRA